MGASIAADSSTVLTDFPSESKTDAAFCGDGALVGAAPPREKKFAAQATPRRHLPETPLVSILAGCIALLGRGKC